jgi:hypothetical protein
MEHAKRSRLTQIEFSHHVRCEIFIPAVIAIVGVGQQVPPNNFLKPESIVEFLNEEGLKAQKIPETNDGFKFCVRKTMHDLQTLCTDVSLCSGNIPYNRKFSN